MKIDSLSFPEFRSLFESYGLVWDGKDDRGTFRHRDSERVVLSDVCPRTNRAYAYPPSAYHRPKHARSYDHDVAVNLQDLTINDVEELMSALGVSKSPAKRPKTIRRPGPR